MSNISVTDAVKGGKSLRDFLAYYLKESVLANHLDSSRHHPVITVNALKNIIGDDVDHPSEILLKSAYELVKDLPKRSSDSELLNRASADGLGETAFVSDIWEKLESGDIDTLELEAAKIHLVSDRSPAVFESLAEYALTNIPEFGSFTYHVLRAFAFQNDPKGSWPFIMCVLGELKEVSVFEMHPETDHKPREYIGSVVVNGNQDQWLDLAGAARLWASEYIRTENYHREISHWLSTLGENIPLPPADKKAPELTDFTNSADSYFIGLAEDVIAKENGLRKIPVLEALRTLARRVSKKDIPHVEAQIQLFLKSEM